MKKRDDEDYRKKKRGTKKDEDKEKNEEFTHWLFILENLKKGKGRNQNE